MKVAGKIALFLLCVVVFLFAAVGIRCTYHIPALVKYACYDSIISEMEFDCRLTAQSPTPAPAFELSDFSGKSVRFSEFKGKLLLISFWLVDCPPCKMEMPMFAELYKEYHSRGLEVISMTSTKKWLAEGFVKNECSFPYQALHDPDGKISKAYGFTSFPGSVLVDRCGQVVYSGSGYDPRQKAQIETSFRQAIEKVLVDK
ncbi:MAG: TlpA disulfide reductase family protein [Candidatus Paceibacterota bacterium]